MHILLLYVLAHLVIKPDHESNMLRIVLIIPSSTSQNITIVFSYHYLCCTSPFAIAIYIYIYIYIYIVSATYNSRIYADTFTLELDSRSGLLVIYLY